MAEQSPPERGPCAPERDPCAPERDFVERHLGRAWRSFSPDASLQDRVRARLTSSTAATMGTIGTGLALKTRPEGTWASLQASSKLGTALVGAGLLGMGLLSGYLIRDTREEPVPPPLPPIASSAAAPALPLPPELILAPSPAPARAAPAVPRVPRAERSLQQRAKALALPPEARSGALETSEPSEELALLRRAERAVRGADSALALALIAELEERYPRSSLLEERRAVELLAYCAAGASDAVARAQRFLREHPRSVHAGRITEKCADTGELSTTGR
jgi:hypothetical protein